MGDDTLTSSSSGIGRAVRTRHVLHQVHPVERTLVLEPGTVVLGRDPSAGVVITDDPSMSRFHIRLEVAHEVAVSDVGSHNGTFVNGRQVTAAALEDGDCVRGGDSFFVYRRERGEIIDARVPGILGRAPALRALRAELAQFAPTRLSMLLLGESGTGKTTGARALHDLSGRRGPFVEVNAAAIARELAESLLFGHVAGAFSGATADALGFFRRATRGTLFLDEIGLMAPATQGALLRAVESGVVTPVGGADVQVDVRLVTATNEDLRRAVAEGRFRADLYARLAQVVVHVPPLRACREDLLRLFRSKLGTEQRLSAGLVDKLLGWSWPLNVRELSLLADELRVRSDGMAQLGSELVGDRLDGEPANTVAPPSLDGPPERDELERLLRDAAGNVSEVARRVGRSTKQVYRWCARLEVDPATFRAD